MAGAQMGGALGGIHQLFDEGTAAGLGDAELLERFLSAGDDAAFAALVERHGPMVLRSGRSVLSHPEDIADVFQATFLVLVCKARSIRGRPALGAWLQQVAHRVAVRAGVESARRRCRERDAGMARAANIHPHRDEREDDWRPVLREELSRLSDRYRLPLLLCDLEGRTQAEAAAELGCGEATVRRRLKAARALLRSRLGRRGWRSRPRPGYWPPHPADRPPRASPRNGSRRPCGPPGRGARERAGWPSTRWCPPEPSTWPASRSVP